MKWNWGTGIFIVIVVFTTAAITFFIWSQTQDWSLVENDYYPKELRHEEKLNKIRHANALSGQVLAGIEKPNLVVRFPSDFKGKDINGKLDIYRPSDAKLDVILPVALDTALRQFVPLSNLKTGKYVVKVEWTSAGKDYYWEQDIFIP